MSKLPTKYHDAAMLFRNGYRAALKDGMVLVRKPDRVTIYRVDPARLTCNCTAGMNGVVCKHVLGLPNLLCWTAMNIDDNDQGCREPGNPNAYTALGFERRRRAVEMYELAADVRNRVEAWQGREREQKAVAA